VYLKIALKLCIVSTRLRSCCLASKSPSLLRLDTFKAINMTMKPVGNRLRSLPPGHPSLRLQQLDTSSVIIPPFLQDILSAHPTPPTPSPANPGPALYTLPQAPPPPEDPLIPPENFSVVCSGVYRSGFPKKRNFEFMETLRLKTVLTLVLEDYPDSNLKWFEERDVQFMVNPKS
jgi:hypothetical protein